MCCFACTIATAVALAPAPATAATLQDLPRLAAAGEQDSACVEDLVRKIVADDRDAVGPQRLHIGPLRVTDEGPGVSVHWQDARAILLIDPRRACADRNGDHGTLGWYRTKARIDLDTDVVPTLQDIHGSTYLVARPWVDAVIADCHTRGTLLVVEGRPAP